jgi:hypothetical protein
MVTKAVATQAEQDRKQQQITSEVLGIVQAMQ